MVLISELKLNWGENLPWNVSGEWGPFSASKTFKGYWRAIWIIVAFPLNYQWHYKSLLNYCLIDQGHISCLHHAAVLVMSGLLLRCCSRNSFDFLLTAGYSGLLPQTIMGIAGVGTIELCYSLFNSTHIDQTFCHIFSAIHIHTDRDDITFNLIWKKESTISIILTGIDEDDGLTFIDGKLIGWIK